MSQIEVCNKYITDPLQTEGQDGIGYWHGEQLYIHDCYIDLQNQPLGKLDEAVGITYGAYGLIENCVIRGAGKLILCGSGDRKAIPLETGKKVLFRNCILEQGGRRFPEVQDGMHVTLENCLIQEWGKKTRFTERSFGAWAHHKGSIFAYNCVFRQKNTKRGILYWLADKIGHFGQAWNDEKLRGIFKRKTYIAGTKRALTADSTGFVQAIHCYAYPSDLIIENCNSYMSEKDADALIQSLENMRSKLKTRLHIV